MFSSNAFEQFLSDFRETIVDATARLRHISPAESRGKAVDGDWAPLEILGHLIDSAANNHQRFVRAQFTDDLVFPGYEQDRWVSAQNYREASWPDLVQLWSSYNLHLIHLISAIPANVLTKSRTKHNLHEIAFAPVSTDEPATLEYFVRDYVDHLRHHLDQIFNSRNQ